MKVFSLTPRKNSWRIEWRSFLLGLFVGAVTIFGFIQIRIPNTTNFYEVMSNGMTDRFYKRLQAELQPLSRVSENGCQDQAADRGKPAEDYPLQVYDDSVARDLAQKVRILCWVMTGSSNHHKAKVVRDTWGRKCNMLLFFSDVEDPTVPTLKLEDVHEGHNHLWGKTKQGFEYVYEKYINDYDWFFKVDDDTFLIPENARFMLSRHDPETPLWFGCKFKPYVEGGYNSGGAGYVLSREAVRRFIEKALKAPDDSNCRLKDDQGAEDVEIGRCLQSVGVKNGDSRDEFGRGRFFPFGPEDFTNVSNMTVGYWYWNYIFYKNQQGPNCCSDTAISFHYINPSQMRMLNYVIYTLHPYGISSNFRRDVIPPPSPDEKLMEKPWIGVDEEYRILKESQNAADKKTEEKI